MSKTLKHLLLWLLMVLPVQSMACDMCGCYMGITPYDNQSSIQVLHRYRAFNGYYGMNHEHAWFPEVKSALIPAISTPAKPIAVNQVRHGGQQHDDVEGTAFSNTDYEVYQVSELRGKYFLSQRLEINAFIPVNNFHFYENGVGTHVTGLGDVTCYAAYHAIRKIEVEGVQHRLIGGMGAKLPTGNFEKTSNGERLPLSMQNGTGSLDFFFMANYILGWKKFGMSMTSSLKLNTYNSYNERAGNSTTQYLNVFYKIKKGNWFIIPTVQNYYEFSAQGIGPDLMSMNVLYTGAGLDVFYKNIGFTTCLQAKTWEQQSEGKIAGTSRLAIGLTFNFNQTKYLLK
ncbi:MAG TPA: hypothetical protein VK177_21750 [Flavobacteriales bacterium]|nr:hypothetical protein [Flavobacteriales bacterium]